VTDDATLFALIFAVRQEAQDVEGGHDGPTDEGDCYGCSGSWPCPAERLREVSIRLTDHLLNREI
jgi:hypothetical protein